VFERSGDPHNLTGEQAVTDKQKDLFCNAYQSIKRIRKEAMLMLENTKVDLTLLSADDIYYTLEDFRDYLDTELKGLSTSIGKVQRMQETREHNLTQVRAGD